VIPITSQTASVSYVDLILANENLFQFTRINMGYKINQQSQVTK